jgi:hypothetical protein
MLQFNPNQHSKKNEKKNKTTRLSRLIYTINGPMGRTEATFKR